MSSHALSVMAFAPGLFALSRKTIEGEACCLPPQREHVSGQSVTVMPFGRAISVWGSCAAGRTRIRRPLVWTSTRSPGAEMAADRGGRDLVDGIRERKSPFRLLRQQSAHGVGDLLATAIGNGNGQDHSLIDRRGFLGGSDRRDDRARQQLELADGLHSNPPAMDLRIMGERADLR